jgi:hypothetical protein
LTRDPRQGPVDETVLCALIENAEGSSDYPEARSGGERRYEIALALNAYPPLAASEAAAYAVLEFELIRAQ